MEQKKLYETLFLVNNSLGEENVKGLVTKFLDLINANAEAESVSVNEWGVRKLAYPIQDLTEAYYVLVRFKSAHDFPAELTRIYNITDGILRSLTLAVEE